MKSKKVTRNKLWIIFIFWSTEITAQSIQGTIVDKDSRLPISNVLVKVFNSSLSTVTDNFGKFELKGVSGNPLVFLSAPGYASKDHVAADSIQVLEMERSSIYLNNITVTARRFETNKFEVSEAVSIVSGKQLEKISSRSAPEALMGSTGVWIQKTNHGGGSPIIRGLVGNHILLMVDGIRMNNATYRYGPNQYLSTVDPGLIEKIEASRGNGSVLYGSDAIGGVVQVISKTPHFRPDGNELHGSATGRWMSGGMEKSARGELQMNGKRIAGLGGLSFRKYGDIIAGSPYGKLHPTGYDELSGDIKILVKAGNDGLVTAAYQHHRQNDVPRFDQIIQGGYSTYSFDPQVRELTYLRWEKVTASEILNRIRMTASFNHSGEYLKSQKNGSQEIKNQEDVVNTFSAVAEIHSVFSNSWQAQSGIESYHDIVGSKAKILNTVTNEEREVRGSFTDGATAQNLAIFSSHTVDIDKFSISGGARLNLTGLTVNDEVFGIQNILNNALVGNAGISYELFEKYLFFAQMNTGFRAPNIDDMSRFGAVETTVFEVPGKNLAPEKSRTVESGVKTRSKNFSGSVTGFYTVLSDMIERTPAFFEGLDTIENRRVYQKQNIGQSILYGIEGESEIELSSRFSFTGNLTYTYGENSSKHEPMRRIPPLFGKVGIHYLHGSGFWILLEYLSAGQQDRLAKSDLSDPRITVRLKNGIMPSWSIVNFYGGYQYKFLTMRVAAQNLFDKGYRVYSSGVDGYGRSLTISLTGRF